MNILRLSTLSLTLAISVITLSYANLSSAETPGGRGFGKLLTPAPDRVAGYPITTVTSLVKLTVAP